MCWLGFVSPIIQRKWILSLEVLDGKSYKEKDEYFPQAGLYTHWIVYSLEKDEVVGLFTDSTEAVEANRALDRSEETFFKNIFANIPAGVERSMIRMDICLI